VLLVQALFADGGITALGLNIVNMGLVGGLGGYVVFLGARRLLPRTRSGVVAASAVAAGLSVVLAATAFVLEYAIGGTVDLSLRAVLGAMVGVHVLIGIGEAVITAMTVSAVLSVRPDLVHGAADLLPAPTVQPAMAR
jgi:cobalt/nickel transport system permease protein